MSVILFNWTIYTISKTVFEKLSHYPTLLSVTSVEKAMKVASLTTTYVLQSNIVQSLLNVLFNCSVNW